jgi:hypothetical protein
MKIKKITLIAILIALVVFKSYSLAALTMTVGNGNADVDQAVQITITVDDPTGIAAAAFTLTYDISHITLTDIQTAFFDTFQNQWNAIDPIPDPLPPISVQVDDTTYTQPLFKKDLPSGTMIVAARCTPADNSNSTLFTLSFVLNQGAPHGIYPVGITSSTISNTDAGYDENGEFVPILIGADSTKDATDPLAFPVLLDPDDQNVGGTLVAGSVTFGIIPGADTDEDGILDDGDNSGSIDNFCADGITSNCDDNCTSIDNPDQINTDNDNFGNACDDDDDNDGVLDENDDCPLDPGKTSPGICGCGVADIDTDNDAVMDCEDDCPNDPDKISPGICGCHVVDIDTDNDGVMDCEDDCPDDHNKTSPGFCGCGLPDDDTDDDGTLNCFDLDDDDDGMPDTWENTYGLDPLTDDALEDADGDGYANIDEYALGSDPTNRNDPDPKVMPWLPILLE